MSVIGDEYDNFEREGPHYNKQPKFARIPSFDDIEEGDYVMVSHNAIKYNFRVDTYYLIQKKIGKATLLVFHNGSNVKIRYRQADNDLRYHLTSPVLNYGNLQIVKFEDESDHYTWLQQIDLTGTGDEMDKVMK